ncbi:MAG: energy transducer TonB [Rhodothermales bacterium]|nr:energy transducer TonB [Rhodothermales bacterium]
MIRAVPAGTYNLRITHGGRTVSNEEIEVPGANSQVAVKRLVRRPAAAPDAPPPPPPPPPTMAEDEVFVVVEQMPTLIGGLESIMRDITYPAIAKKAGIEGRVIVQFVVDEEGNPTNPQVVRGIGGGCDEEAVRAVMAAQFEPGMQRGRTVKVKMSLPVVFKLAT